MSYNRNDYQLSQYDYNRQNYNNYYGNNYNNYNYNSGNRSGGSFNAKLTASLVLGIVSTAGSVVFGFTTLMLFIWLCLGCGIVGIILSVQCRKRLKLYRLPTGKATAAMVLSIVGTCLSGLMTLFTICALAAFGSYYGLMGSLGYF